MKKLLMSFALVLLVPATAFAGVMVQNKDKAKVKILIKRSNTTMSDTVAPGVTLDLPGAPMKITIEKSGVFAEANEGDTLVIEKGKITRIAADGSEDSGEPVEPEPEAEAEATPEAKTE